ncbi:MAG: c-type cytochrome [Bacteroidota bacterium]
MKKYLLITTLFLGYGLFVALTHYQSPPLIIEAATPLWTVLEELGAAGPNHKVNTNLDKVSVALGRNLVLKGSSKGEGGRSRQQSKHFVCTSCHNVQREDPDLKIADPQARLRYAKEKGIPFLQGTTLYGAVNRSSFYNGDYEKKYGDLVKPTRNNIREAIQLCAVECSQGRRLKDWELESVLAYLWTLEFKMEDLELTAEQMTEVQNAVASPAQSTERMEMVKWLQSQYLSGSPAHFVDGPSDRKKGFELEGDAENGQLVYDLSCKHCHENQRYSFFNLDDSKMTFAYLKRHFKRYSKASIYQVTRYGTPSIPGKAAYMPQYTSERMSDQQLEDLRAYIEQKAGE